MRTYLLWRCINVYLTSFHFILILSCHVYFDDLLYMKHTCEQKNDKIGLKFSICQLKNEYPAIHFKFFEKKKLAFEEKSCMDLHSNLEVNLQPHSSKLLST